MPSNMATLSPQTAPQQPACGMYDNVKDRLSMPAWRRSGLVCSLRACHWCCLRSGGKGHAHGFKEAAHVPHPLADNHIHRLWSHDFRFQLLYLSCRQAPPHTVSPKRPGGLRFCVRTARKGLFQSGRELHGPISAAKRRILRTKQACYNVFSLHTAR